MYPDAGYGPHVPGSGWNEEPTRAEVFGRIDAAIYTTDAHGWLTYYNEAAADLWGYRPELGTTRWCGSWRIYTPDGVPLPLEECPMAVAVRQGREARGARAILERPDGTLTPFTLFPTPLRDGSGKVVGGANMLVTLPGPASRPACGSAGETAAALPANDARLPPCGDGVSATEPVGDGERSMRIRVHVASILRALSDQ